MALLLPPVNQRARRRLPAHAREELRNQTVGRGTMKKILGVALALLFVVAVGGAWAGDIDGKITSVDMSARTIQLDYNTEISVAEGISMNTLKEGANIKASYEERAGKKVATKVEVAP